MHPFQAGEKTYERSIAIDASTIDGITVTVAVSVDRDSELEILDSIYSAAEDYSFYPFRDKSNDLIHSEHSGFFESVIDKNSNRLNATTHLGSDGSDSERVEAVQSAILVSELGLTNALIILDGDENKAERFGRAIAGIRKTCPPLVTCVQSELYYPASLLADLCASHVAATIKHPRHCSEVTPCAPVTKEEFNEYWGRAYNSMVNISKPISTEQIEQRRAETVSDRISCWFKGHMGGGDPIEFDTSIQPVVQHVRNQGYEDLAYWLSTV